MEHQPVSEYHDRQYSTIGFAIYDIIHIVVALTLLIRLFVVGGESLSEGELIISVSEQLLEITLGFLLICFVLFIFKNTDIKLERFAYTFAWILASLALFLPNTLNFYGLFHPESPSFINTAAYLFTWIDFVFSLLAIVFFAIAISRVKHHPKLWSGCILLGMACLFVDAACSLALVINEATHEHVFDIFIALEFLSALAPLAPILVGMKDMLFHHQEPEGSESKAN